MTQQLEPAPQVTGLRLQFFPTPPSLPADVPDRTRLVEKPAGGIADALNRGPFLTQCNCACK